MPQLKPGYYYGRLVEIGTDRSSKGTPCIYIVWEVTHQDVGGEWAPMQAERRTTRWWTNEKAESFTVDKLIALGFNGDLDRPEFTGPNDPRKGITLECRHEEYQGKVQERWDTPAAQVERTPWKGDEKRTFKAKFQTRRAASQAPTAGAPAPPPARPQAEPDASPVRDEEVPTGSLADAGRAMMDVMDVSDDEIPF